MERADAATLVPSAAWLGPQSRPWVMRYGVAVGAVLVAFLIATLLGLVTIRANFFLFLAAVVLASMFGGRGPGLLATILSAPCVAYIDLPPAFNIHVESIGDVIGLVLF